MSGTSGQKLHRLLDEEGTDQDGTQEEEDVEVDPEQLQSRQRDESARPEAPAPELPESPEEQPAQQVTERLGPHLGASHENRQDRKRRECGRLEPRPFPGDAEEQEEGGETDRDEEQGQAKEAGQSMDEEEHDAAP